MLKLFNIQRNKCGPYSRTKAISGDQFQDNADVIFTIRTYNKEDKDFTAAIISRVKAMKENMLIK